MTKGRAEGVGQPLTERLVVSSEVEPRRQLGDTSVVAASERLSNVSCFATFPPNSHSGGIQTRLKGIHFIKYFRGVATFYRTKKPQPDADNSAL